MFNAAFLSARVPTELELARRVSLASVHFRARGLDWAYWVCESWLDRAIVRRSRKVFQQYGLRHSVDMPGMESDRVLPPDRKLPTLDCRRVSEKNTRDAFCAIGSLCFGVPLPWFREVFDNDAVWDSFEGWVGYVDQEPVSTAAIVSGGGVLGVYNVATMPGHQCRGYAESLMRHALADAQARHGIEKSILQSTPAGLALYERMGYRQVTRVSVYAS
jgi:ribosomal protein S18 acetylase RimI-like enzyme